MTHKYLSAWSSRVPVLVFILAGWLGFPDCVLGQTLELTGGSFRADTLGDQIGGSRYVSVLEVVNVDRIDNVIYFRKTADLKGVNARKEIQHNLNDHKDLLQWAQPGKQAILFEGNPLCRVCVGNCWYGYSDSTESCLAMPALPMTYCGPVEKLRRAIIEILAGREVVITARQWQVEMELGSLGGDWLRGKRGRIWRIRAGPKINYESTLHPENKKVFVGWGIGGPEAVPALVKSLKDKDARARCAAAEDLGQIGPPAVKAMPALVQALSDVDGFVPVCAAEALARIDPGQKSWLPILVKALKHQDQAVRATAAESLGALGEISGPAVANLILALQSENAPAVRSIAASALARINREPRLVVPALARAMMDSSEEVRRSAGPALMRFGRHTSEIIPVLGQLLVDAEEQTGCDYALMCLRWHQDKAILPVGEALLRSGWNGLAEFLGDMGPAARKAVPALLLAVKEEETRFVAAVALSRILPDYDAVPILTEMLSRDSQRVRVRALLALERLGSKADAAIPALIKLLESEGPDFHCRIRMVRALGQMGPKARTAIPVLADVLQNAKEQTWARREAAQALVRLQDRAAIPILKKVLQDPVVSLQAHAALALWQLGEPADRSIQVLVKLLEDKEGEYGGLAATELGKMGPAAKRSAGIEGSAKDQGYLVGHASRSSLVENWPLQR